MIGLPGGGGGRGGRPVAAIALAVSLLVSHAVVAASTEQWRAFEAETFDQLLGYWFEHDYLVLPADVLQAIPVRTVRTMYHQNQDLLERWHDDRPALEAAVAAEVAAADEARRTKDERRFELFVDRIARGPQAAADALKTKLVYSPTRKQAFVTAFGELDYAARVEAQRTLAELVGAFREVRDATPWRRFGFVSTAPRPLSLMSSAFLHRNWMVLLIDMLMVLLLGIVLERRWGSGWMPLIFISGSAFGCAAHGLAHPEVDIPLIGAHAAVGALAGAYLPVLRRFPGSRAAAPLGLIVAWVVIQELLADMDPGAPPTLTSLLAGIVYGMVIYFPLRFAGVERVAHREAHPTFDGPGAESLAEGHAKLGKGLSAAALAAFRKALTENPSSLDAQEGILEAYRRSGDSEGVVNQTLTLQGIYARARDATRARLLWDELLAGVSQEAIGPERMAAAAGNLSTAGAHELAARILYGVAEHWPDSLVAGEALVRYGRLCVEELGRPADAAAALELAIPAVTGRGIWESEAHKYLELARTAAAGIDISDKLPGGGADRAKDNAPAAMTAHAAAESEAGVPGMASHLKGRRYKAWTVALVELQDAGGFTYRGPDGTDALVAWGQVQALGLARVGDTLTLDLVIEALEDESSIELRALRLEAGGQDYAALGAEAGVSPEVGLMSVAMTLVERLPQAKILGDPQRAADGNEKQFADAAAFQAWLFGKLLGHHTARS